MKDQFIEVVVTVVKSSIATVITTVASHYIISIMKNKNPVLRKRFLWFIGTLTFAIAFLLIGHWLPGCGPKPVTEYPFSFSGGKLHIFSRSDGPKMATLPGEAEVCITTSKPPFVLTAKVDLEEGVQSVKKLVVAIQYEYHADHLTNRNSASLQFALKDSAGKEVWSKTQGFLPAVVKTLVGETNVFSIDRKYDQRDITVEVTPLRSGDFGFFIYQLNGTLTAQ